MVAFSTWLWKLWKMYEIVEVRMVLSPQSTDLSTHSQTLRELAQGS